ncbi:hypothetical protein HWV62_34849 [Athelia sp. TMB]|nr:hypothetical protein HWV62_42524 [Athelia sp. TMB]KAF7981121.1 hypothetical protein HWV62_34849 [Athelia sp. TMB]
MPLPSDETLITLSNDLIAQFKGIFGDHQGFRPAHARGVLLTGVFTPTPEAAKLSSAPHFTKPSTTVTARFSSSTGIPNIPDTDPNANPRGFAVRFNLAEHVHTDIVSHSTPGFPTRTGAEFLEFLKALATSPPDAPHPNPVEAFLGSHPGALAFVQAPKPFPSSFGREAYFGVSAFKFTNAEGVTKFARYQIVPDAGVDNLDEAGLKDKGPNYLFDEVPQHIAKGPISFHLHAQIANDGDVTDDATIKWPEDRAIVNLGKITLDAVVTDNDKEQKKIIYDPIPRVQGIEPSEDPLFELRAALYLISGRQRRAAP